MANLEKTEAALADYAANRGLLFGIHDAEEFKVGAQGRDVGEIPFDPAQHDVSAINPLSIWESVTGEPHVRVALPERPLHLTIVTQHRAAGRSDYPQMNQARQRLASELGAAINESLPGITDRAWNYAVGEAVEGVADSDVEVIDTNGDPLVEARTIAELCRDGLTFVISDFLALPLEREACSGAVAIKANHAFDIALPAGYGSLPTNIRGGEVNTDKPRELVRVNRSLQERHDRTAQRLETAGIAMAHILFNWRDYPTQGFDMELADERIAAAISALQPRAE